MRANAKIFGMIMAGTMIFIGAQTYAISSEATQAKAMPAEMPANATKAAMPADAIKGKALFADSCASFRCHAMGADYLIGWPVPKMLERIDEYKKMENTKGRVATMRNAMIALSEQELLDVSTYLNEVK